MSDDPDPIPVGSTGTVTFVNEHGSGERAWRQIGVDWDNGRRRMLSVPPDEVDETGHPNASRRRPLQGLALQPSTAGD